MRVPVSGQGRDTECRDEYFAVRFRHMFNWDGKETVIMSRAIDETGHVQPTRAQFIAARGVGSGPYHRNSITGESWG